MNTNLNFSIALTKFVCFFEIKPENIFVFSGQSGTTIKIVQDNGTEQYIHEDGSVDGPAGKNWTSIYKFQFC